MPPGSGSSDSGSSCSSRGQVLQLRCTPNFAPPVTRTQSPNFSNGDSQTIPPWEEQTLLPAPPCATLSQLWG